MQLTEASWRAPASISLGAVFYFNHFHDQNIVVNRGNNAPITGAIFPIRTEVSMQGLTD